MVKSYGANSGSSSSGNSSRVFLAVISRLKTQERKRKKKGRNSFLLKRRRKKLCDNRMDYAAWLLLLLLPNFWRRWLSLLLFPLHLKSLSSWSFADRRWNVKRAFYFLGGGFQFAFSFFFSVYRFLTCGFVICIFLEIGWMGLGSSVSERKRERERKIDGRLLFPSHERDSCGAHSTKIRAFLSNFFPLFPSSIISSGTPESGDGP